MISIRCAKNDPCNENTNDHPKQPEGRKCLTQIASSSSWVPPSSLSNSKFLHKWDSGLPNETSDNLQRKCESYLNLPRSVYTLTLWVMGKFTTPTPPIPTTSFIKAAITSEPACLAAFAAIVIALRLLIKSGSDGDVGCRSADAELGSESDKEQFSGCVGDQVGWAVPLWNIAKDTLYIGIRIE